VVFLSQWVVVILLHLLLKSFHVHIHFIVHAHIAVVLHIVAHLLLFVAFHLSLLVEDIFLVQSVDLRLDAHLSVFLHLSLSLHLDDPSSLHLRVLVIHRLLSHPHLVVFHVIVVVQLIHSLLLNLLLALDISHLCDVVSFVELLFD